MMRWAIKGASKEQVLQKGRDFAEKEVAIGLRPGAQAAIAAHKANGDILIMISAAVDVIARPMGELLGFDYVAATEMVFTDCNIVQLNFSTPNCYGPEKVNRYKALIIDSPRLQAYHSGVTFYSDSYSDLAMFSLADISIAVHPDKKLSQYAAENQWPIVKW